MINFETMAHFSANYLPIDIWLILQNGDLFLIGVMNTVVLTVISLIIGGTLAVVLALVRVFKIPVISQLTWLFIYVERGSPLLIQLYLIYYGLSQFDFIKESILWNVLEEPFYCALIALSLNTAAYTAEIIKGGILSIPKGEIEAAFSYGMSRLQCIYRIILPRAFRYSIPAYGNEVVLLLHGSVVVSTITIIDILGAARTINAKYYIVYEGFLTAALLYIILCIVINKVFRYSENRWLQFITR